MPVPFFGIGIRLIFSVKFLLCVCFLCSFSPLHAVYTSHLRSDKDYQKAADPFSGVVLIRGKNTSKTIHSSGSGTLIKDISTGKIYVLTASHVLKGADHYEISFRNRSYPLGGISHFYDFLFESFSEKTILVAKNLSSRKRLFVLRLKEEKDHLKEVLMSYGLDLGIAFVEGLKDISPDDTYTLEKVMSPKPENSWVIGFGEAGSGTFLGKGFPFWVYGSGKKRAFEVTLSPQYQFQFLNGETMQVEGEVYSYASTFIPGDQTLLSGHVGPGDSGGPALSKASSKVIALVSGTVSMLKKQDSDRDTFWEKILRRAGRFSGSRSPLSYFLWQEANVYGSEAIYAGVTTPLIHQWIWGEIKKTGTRYTHPT